LLDYLRDGDSRLLGARAVRLRISIPAESTRPVAWDDELRTALSAERSADLGAGISNMLVQRQLRTRGDVLLWLDFQAHPVEDRTFKLIDWLETCNRWTSELQLDGIRLAFFVGFRAANDERCREIFAKLRTALPKYMSKLFSPQLLDELGPALYDDLLELLSSSADVRLEGDEQRWVASRILDECNAPPEHPRSARYDQVIAALQRGRRTEWNEFLKGLKSGGQDADDLF
jgi:hypothetical protein